jgi:SAM-dependent methyltransferase
VKPDFAEAVLRCPVCRRDRTLSLLAATSDAREVREGTLRCSACGAEFEVHRGVAHLLHDPPEHVVREAAGLERFAERMRADGWDADTIRRLPENEDGYWYAQDKSLHQVLSTVEFRAGERILDVGSNTCWAANRFARHGLQAIALDIATTELQGLYTADYFIAPGLSYFERVLGTMNDMPIASESLDFVYCCEVLHHNDAEGLRRAFEESFRVLKPGGRLLVVNETLKTLRDPVGVHVEAVAEFEGHEHAHWALRYRWEATRAGFSTRLLEPSYHWFYGAADPSLGGALAVARASRRSGSTRAAALRNGLIQTARTNAPGRRLYLAWIYHVAGRTQMSMIATKPRRARLRGSRRRTARPG